MLGLANVFSFGGLSPARMDLVVDRCPPPPRAGRPRPRQLAADDHLYFSVRSFAATGRRHVLQYAFVDDRGNVVFSAFGGVDSSVPSLACGPPEDLVVEPLDPEALEYLLTRICNGATLVGFGRVLQTSLLPLPVLQGAAGVECAWRRFLRVGRRRGGTFNRGQPVTLGDAVTSAGLPALESEDAAMRALAIRDLWSWMDQFEN